MKTSTLKLKKFKATRMYGFSHDPNSSNLFLAETTTPLTTSSTCVGRVKL